MEKIEFQQVTAMTFIMFRKLFKDKYQRSFKIMMSCPNYEASNTGL